MPPNWDQQRWVSCCIRSESTWEVKLREMGDFVGGEAANLFGQSASGLVTHRPSWTTSRASHQLQSKNRRLSNRVKGRLPVFVGLIESLLLEIFLVQKNWWKRNQETTKILVDFKQVFGQWMTGCTNMRCARRLLLNILNTSLSKLCGFWKGKWGWRDTMSTRMMGCTGLLDRIGLYWVV